MNKDKLRYILYARKSSDSEDKQISSIADQKRELEPEIKRLDLKVVKEFGESQSAKKPGRPMFDEMMIMIKQGKADGILCWKLNRLARNPIDGGEIQWLLQQGVIKSIITPSKEYLPTDNVLMMAFELGMANQFILDLSNDVRRGLKTKLADGWRPGIAPMGYRNDKFGNKGKKIIFIDDEKFPLVKKLWQTFLTHEYSLEQITRYANDKLGLRGRAGLPLHKSTIRGVLINPFYYGEYCYGGGTYQGKHTPMITVEEFDFAQNILGKIGKPRMKHKRLPFTGMIKCEECGGTIVTELKWKIVKSENLTRKYLYHRCSRNRTGVPCNQKPVNHADLVEQIKNYIDQITIPEEFLIWATDVLRQQKKLEETDRGAVLKLQQKTYDSCLKSIDNLIAMYISPENKDRELLSDEEYKAQKMIYMREKVRIEEEMSKIQDSVNESLELTEKIFNFATYAKYHFDNGNFEVKTKILKFLGQSFTLKDKKLSIELREPFVVLKEGLKEISSLEPTIFSQSNNKNSPSMAVSELLSGRPDSNRRPSPWQGDVLAN